jgi:hypothetical protein
MVATKTEVVKMPMHPKAEGIKTPRKKRRVFT